MNRRPTSARPRPAGRAVFMLAALLFALLVACSPETGGPAAVNDAEELSVQAGGQGSGPAGAGACPGTLLDGPRALAGTEPQGRANYYNAPPAPILEEGVTYYAALVTEKGDLCLRLFADDAPITVNNFVFLAQNGYYDGTTFHRVIADFMAQGGDPSGTGRGGPGYLFADETQNGRVFDRRGLLAMANAGPGTNGSQFFITFVPTPHLNGNHTIFGELISGDNVLSAIRVRDPREAEPGDSLLRVDIYAEP